MVLTPNTYSILSPEEVREWESRFKPRPNNTQRGVVRRAAETNQTVSTVQQCSLQYECSERSLVDTFPSS